MLHGGRGVPIDVDVEGHGIGKVIVPLVVRPQAAKEMPANIRRLKQRLEGSDAPHRLRLNVPLSSPPAPAPAMIGDVIQARCR